MAITFTLVSRGPNHLVYQAESGGSTAAFDTGTLQVTGAGGADVALEDAVVPPAGASWNAGLLKEIVDRTGVTTDAIAKRQLQDAGGLGLPTVGDGISNVNGKRARVFVIPDIPTGGDVLKAWAVSAQTNGAGQGQYVVFATAAGTAGALVVIEAIGTPQQF